MGKKRKYGLGLYLEWKNIITLQLRMSILGRSFRFQLHSSLFMKAKALAKALARMSTCAQHFSLQLDEAQIVYLCFSPVTCRTSSSITSPPNLGLCQTALRKVCRVLMYDLNFQLLGGMCCEGQAWTDSDKTFRLPSAISIMSMSSIFPNTQSYF